MCWYETNDNEITTSIANVEAKVEDLATEIGELMEASSLSNTETKHLEKEVAEHQEVLDQATAILKKELAEFNA